MKKSSFVSELAPKAIKIASLVPKLKTSASFEVTIYVTAQHRQMLDRDLNFFLIVPDYDLNIMKEN